MNKNTPIVWSFWGHEPLRHLKRMGNDGDSIFTLGDWAEEWYNRIHEEDVVKKAAEKGINLIYTHYFKGFGLKTEYDEMENTKKLCEHGEKHGVKVLGYCQLGSLYNETLMDEVPNLEDWAIHDASGNIVTWLGQYYRYSPCFNSRPFIEYIKKVIKYGIEHVGLSGFHFDNSYNVACHCDKCTEAFRKYLKKNANPEEMGLLHFNHVKIPCEDPARETHDPLYIWWLRYKADLVKAVHSELFSYAKKIGGKDTIVLHNPCFPRPGKTFAKRGFEPSRNSHDCDYVFAENGSSYIRVQNGKIKSMVDAFKFGECFGYKVFDTCWTHDSATGRVRLPESREEVVRFVAQSMIYTGLCGSPWTVRSLKDGHKNLLEDSPLSDSLAEIFGYYHKNFDLFNLPAKNNIKLLYSPDSCMSMLEAGIDNIFNTIEELVTNAIPFSIITHRDIDALKSGQTVIIPKVLYADEKLVESVKNAALRGVKILILGHFARYYEDGKERRHSHFIFELNEADGFYRTNDDFISLLRELNREYEITLGKENILLERKAGKNGEIVLHLLNAANENTIDELTVNICGIKIKSADCISLENTCITKIDNSSITIKDLKTTATLIITEG